MHLLLARLRRLLGFYGQANKSTSDPAGRALIFSMCVVLFFLSLSFGILARQSGMGPWAAAGFSAAVLGGAGQFAFLAVLTAGGSPWAALASGLLVNARFLPLAMSAGAWITRDKRDLVLIHLVIEPSVALGLMQSDARLSRRLFLTSGWSFLAAWTLGTFVGASVGALFPNPRVIGLDAALPCLLVGLLVPLVSRPGGLAVALAAAVVSVALTPLVPAGVSVLLASAVAIPWYFVRRPTPPAHEGG